MDVCIFTYLLPLTPSKEPLLSDSQTIVNMVTVCITVSTDGFGARKKTPIVLEVITGGRRPVGSPVGILVTLTLDPYPSIH